MSKPRNIIINNQTYTKADSNFAMTIDVVYKPSVYKYMPLKHTLDQIFAHERLHITLSCALTEYRNAFEAFAQEVVKMKDIQFIPEYILENRRRILKLGCQNETFISMLRNLRNSEARGLQRFEMFSESLYPIDNLHLWFPCSDDLAFAFELIECIKPKSIYLVSKRVKMFEYFF
jgi:hypothetical protein